MINESHSWRQILDGAVGDSASLALAEIRSALAAQVQMQSASETAPLDDPSLASGYAGLSLLFAEAEDWTPEKRLEMCYLALSAAATSFSRTRRSIYLFGGVAGFAWAGRTIAQRLGQDVVCAEAYVAIEELVLEMVHRPLPANQNFGLLAGLTGLGVYGLANPLSATARAIVSAVVLDLARAARRPRDAAMVYWSRRSASDRRRLVADLGMANGVPGIIAFLSKARAVGLGGDTSADLVVRAVAWLMQYRIQNDPRGCFSQLVSRGREKIPATPYGWCYGDPGVALALLHAAKAFDRSDWSAAAVRIARVSAQRTLKDLPQYPPIDASLCHGAAGLGHLYNRLFQATGDEMFVDAARECFTTCLGLRDQTRVPNIGGFRFYFRDEWMSLSGLLRGAAGVGLCIQSALSDRSPAWDQCMLIDVAPLGL